MRRIIRRCFLCLASVLILLSVAISSYASGSSSSAPTTPPAKGDSMWWSAAANWVKNLFVPDEKWISVEMESVSLLAQKKLGIFFWTQRNIKNFFDCFNNLQAYTGIKAKLPTGRTVTLFYGEYWTMAVSYINPVLTGGFCVFFIVVMIKKFVEMFKQ